MAEIQVLTREQSRALTTPGVMERVMAAVSHPEAELDCSRFRDGGVIASQPEPGDG